MTDYLKRYQRNQRLTEKRNHAAPIPGDVWMAENLDNIKDRPVIVIDSCKGIIRFLRCTSKTTDLYERIPIEDCIGAGLEKDTYVDPGPRSIARGRLMYRIGRLTETDMERFGIC